MAQTKPDKKIEFLRRRRSMAICLFENGCAECEDSVIAAAQEKLGYSERTMRSDILRALKRVWDRIKEEKASHHYGSTHA